MSGWVGGGRSKRQKGCGLCKPHKFKDHGQSIRKPWSELRQIGKLRRVSRHDLGDVETPEVSGVG